MQSKTKSLIFFMGISVLFSSLGCSIIQKGTGEVTDAQKEKDLIELLNTQQIQTSESTPETEMQRLKQQMTELEQANASLRDDVNTLKSEIIMKNERIRQLESEATEIGGQKEVESDKPDDTMTEKTTIEAVKPGPESEFEREYTRARSLFENGKYTEAIPVFEILLEKDRGHSLSDNCQYWTGESYFALRDYKQAIIAFEKVFNFLGSNKDADAQFKLGYSYFQLGRMDEAKREFTKLKANYPKSEYVTRADLFLQKIG